MPDPVLILGASACAAAASAERAGLRPLAADLFGDDDLRQLAAVVQRIDDYPSELPKLAETFPPAAWIFTGGLENFPRTIAAISAERQLWGVPADAIQRVRNPWRLAQRLQDCGLHYPQILRVEQRDDIASHPPGRWIRKPYRSAGGGNMQLVPPGDPLAAVANETKVPFERDTRYYLQRFVEGRSHSAVFVAAHGAAALLGVTRQLIGADWTGATGFRYAGSIGPLQPSGRQLATWCQIGNCLAGGFDLRGLFGVDAIVNDGGVWTIEVNPRYSSSIEVLEYGLDIRALNDHVVACRDGRLNERDPQPAAGFRGKAVVYATREVRVGEALVQAAREANAERSWPLVADIPTAGQTIALGHPVLTLFASGDRLSEIEPRLRACVKAWRTTWRL